MSHDLVFWRQNTDEVRTPTEIYEAICSGQPVDGLIELDIDGVLDRVSAVVDGVEREDEHHQLHWTSSDQSTSFVVEWTSHWLIVLLTGSWSNQIANDLMQAAFDGGCALYDPQVNQRFQQPD